MSWDQHICDATSAVQRSYYVAAEQSLKHALRLAKQEFSRTDSRLALTLSFLGHVDFCQGNFSRAEALLEQSLRLHQKQRFLNRPCVLMDMFCLGRIKLLSFKRLEVCRLLESTIAALQNAMNEGVYTDDDEFARDYAVFQFQNELQQLQGMLTEEELSQWSLESEPDQSAGDAQGESETDTESEDEGEDEQSSVISEETIALAIGPDGTIYDARELEQAELPAAMDVAQLEQAEARLGATSIDAGHMSLLWDMQLQKGLSGLTADDDDHESWVAGYLNIESALRLASKLFNPGDDRLTTSIKALADASAKLRMFEQAEALYRESIACAKRAADCELNVTALRLTLALFYTDFDQLRQAKKILEGAKVPDNLEDSPHGVGLGSRVDGAFRLVGVYDSVQNVVRQAQTAAEQKDLDKAAKLTNTALTMLRQGFAPNHPETARVLRYRSQLLRELGQVDQAEELTQRADRIERAQEGTVSEWIKITADLPKPDFAVSV